MAGYFLLAVLIVLLGSINIISAQTYQVEVTEEHPFLLENGEYVPASELKEGMELKTINGKKARVTSIKDVVLDKPVNVYNLDTENYDNFILPGGVVVHNSDKPIDLFTDFFSGNKGQPIDVVIIDDAGNNPGVIGPLQEFLNNNPGFDVNIMHYRPPSYTKPDAPVYFNGKPRSGAKTLIIDNDMVTGSALENTRTKLESILGQKIDPNKIDVYLYRSSLEDSRPILGKFEAIYSMRFDVECKTPKGEWVTGSDGKPAFITTETRDSPLGFKSDKAWQDYRDSMKQKIELAQKSLALGSDIKVGVQGSAATGVSSKTGQFVSKPGDFDIVMINDNLFDLVMGRADSLARKGELLKGRPIPDQISYVECFRKRGIALLHDARLLPELSKQKFAGSQMEPGIKINQMIAMESSEASNKHTLFIYP